ncbi:DUF2336 domain-containing protein [Devosia sp. Root105]|jgi:uncharacterized protein (DUF2336 family)|uniref:DUF2336 domain-containing protein n=1 Tax=Devosia sp. Root105 TaxID=1736423 RepID=UPI0006FFD319|nr:DUF2336 domain-containing protein [Devosia sp. Root105]KQU96537.1 hypothetical protein ASC68_14305 [Devosia sp. Root105]
MVAYQDFVALSQSRDSEERGQAAHLAAMAYLNHYGPADEHAALYAALIGFLDDPSVRVRGALAYGLLHAVEAPRPILLALLQDSPVIARAVVQYSPALVDADLMALIRGADEAMLMATATRERLSQRVAEALVARGGRPLLAKLLDRPDVPFSPTMLRQVADREGADDAELRGLLLARDDLPADARLVLVQAVAVALRSTRMVSGAVAPHRLERLLRDATDTALTAIGEQEAAAGRAPYAAELVEAEFVSTRVMLHAIVQGHVLFFADCVAQLSETPRDKVFTLLEHGSRSALNALFSRCGLSEAVRNMLARLIFHARAADLADDLAARHFVVTALTEELIVEHDGVIPPELEEAFAYLSEQNVILARRAARGVMSAFAGMTQSEMALPQLEADERLALPAA